jgi:release factor glutamine methyltransferase
VDTLAAEWDATLRGTRVALEVGSGTGYIITSAALLMQKTKNEQNEASTSGEGEGGEGGGGGGEGGGGGGEESRCYATDLNPDAVAATTATLEAHGRGAATPGCQIGDDRVVITYTGCHQLVF